MHPAVGGSWDKHTTSHWSRRTYVGMSVHACIRVRPYCVAAMTPAPMCHSKFWLTFSCTGFMLLSTRESNLKCLSSCSSSSSFSYSYPSSFPSSSSSPTPTCDVLPWMFSLQLYLTKPHTYVKSLQEYLPYISKLTRLEMPPCFYPCT